MTELTHFTVHQDGRVEQHLPLPLPAAEDWDPDAGDSLVGDDAIDWEDEDAASEALYSGKGRRPLKAYLMKASELDQIPPVRWLVEGVLPEDALAVLFAAPGAGKTFVALDWAASLTSGVGEWQGYALRPDARVLYIYAEGAPGLRKRRDAWQSHHGATMGDNLTFLIRAANFLAPTSSWSEATEQGDFDQLKVIVEELRPNLLIVDTMSRAIPGADENDTGTMSLLMDRADQLRELGSNMTVLFIHHTNKNNGYRGSSVIRGQVNTMVELDEGSILRVVKQKDDQEPVLGRVELQPVEGTDSVVPVYHAVTVEPDTDTTKRATILATLSTGPVGFNQLHQGIGGGKDSLRKVLNDLAGEGHVRITQAGQSKVYSLA